MVLEKLPARLADFAIGVVGNPGYDTTRKRFRATESDDLSAMRIAWKQGQITMLAANTRSWVPEELLSQSTIPEAVPVLTLGEIAPLAARQSFKPVQGEVYAEVDLADIDKLTGEVSNGRARTGAELKGSKTPFDEGDLLFARIRPSLNNVVIAAKPHPDLPDTLCGSSEWIRLKPEHDRHFALIAARSSFVRDQLKSTGGQTRPRIKAEDLAPLYVPDPGPKNRAAIDRIVGDALRVRREARQQLDDVAALYEAFGRGDIDEEVLAKGLAALDL